MYITKVIGKYESG